MRLNGYLLQKKQNRNRYLLILSVGTDPVSVFYKKKKKIRTIIVMVF